MQPDVFHDGPTKEGFGQALCRQDRLATLHSGLAVTNGDFVMI
ncbi:hypothetical protein [Mesorhizobium sp. IMUNJ 23232]